MPVYHARDAAIYISTGIPGTASNLLTMTAWTADRTTPMVEITNFDSNIQEQLQGWPALRGTFEGFWNSDETKLFAATTSPTGIYMYLYPTKRAVSKYIACTAWLDASMETRVDQATRVRGNWAAYGTGSVINL